MTKAITNRKHTAKAAGAAALAVAVMAAGSLAYFTDRQEATATATAGTVDVATNTSWTDITGFAPGDMADFGYTISNDGNKSIDVRETIVLKSSVAMDAATQAEFELYHAGDVEQAANGSYVPKAGAEPITKGANRVVSADNTSIRYILDEYILNGTGANAETESGVTVTSQATDYVLVFKDSASNTFQGAELSVDLLAEAKQHRNTNTDTWADVATDSITIGGEATNVVPTRN